MTLPELLMPVDHVLSVNCRHVVSELKRQASVQHPAYMLVELVLRKPPSCAVGGVRKRRKGTGGATSIRPLCTQQRPCGSSRRLPRPRSPASGRSSLWRLALMTQPPHRMPQCSPRRRYPTSHCLAEILFCCSGTLTALSRAYKDRGSVFTSAAHCSMPKL